MISSPILRTTTCALLLGLLAPVPLAAEADVTSRIERLKTEAQQLRDQAEQTYQVTEPGCYDRFRVNACLDDAKKARLETIRQARALESEARKLELAERQRVATEVMKQNPGAPQQPALPSPAGDARIQPSPEAERLRTERAQRAEQAEIDARAARAAQDVERARARGKADAEAAARVEQAARDRARYEERIREYEEKKARDAAGR